MIKIAFFDVDGTLWDSTDSVAEAWNQAIAVIPNRTDLTAVAGKRDLTVHGDRQRLPLRPTF